VKPAGTRRLGLDLRPSPAGVGWPVFLPVTNESGLGRRQPTETMHLRRVAPFVLGDCSTRGLLGATWRAPLLWRQVMSYKDESALTTERGSEHNLGGLGERSSLDFSARRQFEPFLRPVERRFETFLRPV
jgi:hypothetical protein